MRLGSPKQYRDMIGESMSARFSDRRVLAWLAWLAQLRLHRAGLLDYDAGAST
jgi:hypothetical protein